MGINDNCVKFQDQNYSPKEEDAEEDGSGEKFWFVGIKKRFLKKRKKQKMQMTNEQCNMEMISTTVNIPTEIGVEGRGGGVEKWDGIRFLC